MRWDSSGTATELGQLSANAEASVVWSAATLNDGGTTVGWALKLRDNGSSLGRRAVRWDAPGTAATELENLGTSFDMTDSEALAVNAAGTVVGFANTYDATDTFLAEHGVYWGGDTLAIDLNTLLDSSSGWVLNRALAISDTGWIVGNGTDGTRSAEGERRRFSSWRGARESANTVRTGVFDG